MQTLLSIIKTRVTITSVATVGAFSFSLLLANSCPRCYFRDSPKESQSQCCMNQCGFKSTVDIFTDQATSGKVLGTSGPVHGLCHPLQSILTLRTESSYGMSTQSLAVLANLSTSSACFLDRMAAQVTSKVTFRQPLLWQKEHREGCGQLSAPTWSGLSV